MTATPLKVLLYGKDARTDALAEGLQASPTPVELTICGPLRSPGLVRRADRFVACSLSDVSAMVGVARQLAPDLVVVGPEDPLSVGIADAVEDLGYPCFGPTRSHARLETSKSWTRSLLERHGVAGNPLHRTFRSADGLEAFLDGLASAVVKPDGLTGGKGVKVEGEQLSSRHDVLEYARSLLDADGSVVIEERLDGEEFSLQTITDGRDVVHCPVVQDHKRAYDGDRGPNTGGMGTYSCADGSLPFLSEGDVAEGRRVNEATIESLSRELGAPYRGVVYGGFMAVADGLRLIEYNARFGDPEAMNVLPLLEGDLVQVLLSAATGRLAAESVAFAPRATVCKYLVPSSYPEDDADAGAVVSLDDTVSSPDLHCYFAACELTEGGAIRLTSSRALAFVGIGDSLEEAETLAEAGASSVGGPVRHRADIGTAAAVARRISHLQSVRAPAPRPAATARAQE